MARKIQISEVTKKHLRVIAFLVISAGLAYILSILANKPEAVYLAPVINYILYALERELKKEGYVEALRK